MSFRPIERRKSKIEYGCKSPTKLSPTKKESRDFTNNDAVKASYDISKDSSDELTNEEPINTIEVSDGVVEILGADVEKYIEAQEKAMRCTTVQHKARRYRRKQHSTEYKCEICANNIDKKDLVPLCNTYSINTIAGEKMNDINISMICRKCKSYYS